VTLPAEHFEALHSAAADPWGFADRWYERRKRAISLACLPEPHYRTAFEPGCSIGVTTAALSRRCGSLLACDASGTALDRARARLAGRRNVRLERRVLPGDWPAGLFDLVFVSEILYYFESRDLEEVAGAAVRAVAPGGTLLAVHWRRAAEEHPQSGDAAHSALACAAKPELVAITRHVEADFRLDVHVRPRRGEGRGRVSVAQRGGLC
jgi:SAM-dependent methyltransferase